MIGANRAPYGDNYLAEFHIPYVRVAQRRSRAGRVLEPPSSVFEKTTARRGAFAPGGNRARR